MVITCFHHSWFWSSKLVQFESGDGLTGNQMIQSEYRLVAMACAYFLEKQRKKVKPNLKLMALLDLHMIHGSRSWAIPCCYVDCMKCFKVQGKFIIPCSCKQHWHPALTPHNGIQHGAMFRLSKCVKTTPAYCIQQWHPAMARYWHPSMASSNGTQQWHHVQSVTAYCIQQWHPAMAPYHGTQHVQSVKMSQQHSPPIASSNGTQQWHLTTSQPGMAPDHGAQQWHHVQSVKVCHNHSPPLASSSNGTQHPAMASYHMAPTMASYHRTLPWHPAMAPRPVYCIQQWHPAMAPYHMAPSNGQHAAMAPNNDTHHGILPSHLTMAPSNGTTSSLSPPIASSNGTQQWNLTTWHPAMAPSNGTLPWHLTTCHLAMAASNGNATQQWQPSNGTQEWQPATAPRPIRQRVHPPP